MRRPRNPILVYHTAPWELAPQGDTMLPKKGDLIELVFMPDDPDPIEPGTTGTVRSVSGPFGWGPQGDFWQISVDWDTKRSLTLCVPPDQYRVLRHAEEAS